MTGVSGVLVRFAVLNCCAALLLVSPAPTAAQDGDTRNAAVWYQRAIDDLDRLTREELDLVEQYRADPGRGPSPEVQRILAKARPAIDQVLRAAPRGYSDFGLRYEAGFDLLLPHLSPLRTMTKLMQADAAARLHAGDAHAAAERIAAMYRLADHVGDDRLLISSLVSRSIFELAETAAQSGFDRGAFDPAAAALLLRSTQAFDQRDPFQSIDALVMEQTLAVNFVREHFTSDDPAKWSEILGDLTSQGNLDEQFASMTRETLEGHLNQYTALMDRYVEIWSGDDPEVVRAQLKEIEAELEAGRHGLIAHLLLPALSRAYESMLAGRDKLHARVELLEGIVKGQVDLHTLTNAAVWYRRGIAKSSALDQAWRDALDAFDAGAPLTDDEVAALTDSVQAAHAAIADFVEGSNIRRCDFSTERHAREVFVPAYAGGMRDAFRLLALEAVRLGALGDAAGAAQTLGAAFRMAAHLSDDALIVSSLVARDGFLLAARAASAIEQRHHFSEEQRHELAAAIRRSGASDPFGFIGAAVKAREHLAAALWGWGTGVRREPQKQSLSAWLKGVDADGLVYLLAMLDSLQYGAAGSAPLPKPDVSRLGEYLLGETIDLAEIDAPALDELLRAGRAEAFAVPETAQIIGAAARMSSARRDQWATIAWAQARGDDEDQAKTTGDK